MSSFYWASNYWLRHSVAIEEATQTQTLCSLKLSSVCLPHTSIMKRYLNSLAGEFFLLVFNLAFHLILFFFLSFFLYRTSLWLGENRRPSVWHILCWVSLLPLLIFLQMLFMLFFHYAAGGNTEYSTSCFCNPAFKCFPLGEWEGRGSEHLLCWLWALQQLAFKYRKLEGSCPND